MKQTVAQYFSLQPNKSSMIMGESGKGEIAKDVGQGYLFPLYHYQHIERISICQLYIFALDKHNRAVFNQVSEIISQLLWFCIATLCDWLKNHEQLCQPIRSKNKTNHDLSQTFSRAWRRLHVFALISDWFTGLSASVVIGQSNYFGFGLMTLKKKRSPYKRLYNVIGPT